MDKRLSRRAFLGGIGAAAAASGAAGGQTLPTRPFGATGEKVTILAIGCGNRLWAAYKTEDRGAEALQLAFDLGIRYFDTAQGYGDGTSETWVGQVTKSRRKEVFIASKTSARTYDDVLKRCEGSLKRLQTDHLDVLHIHGLGYEEDLEKIEKEGAVRALRKLRDEKTVRFIGITSHTDPATLAQALERYDFNCTQMALNAGMQGRSPDGAGYWKTGGNSDFFGEPIAPKPYPGSSFEDVALPVAVRKKMGIIAMKITAQEGLIGSGPNKASASQLIQYALSLPVSLVTVGMPQLELIRKNTELARNFEPMPKSEMKELSTRLAEANKTALDYHFNHDHHDA
jgi:predicted aldo/keto reductase-like oxidoreductase